MSGERWFPLKHEVLGDVRLGRLLYGAEDWKIFDAGNKEKALIARTSLSRRWIEAGLLHDTIDHFCFGNDVFCLVRSGAEQRLEPVSNWGSIHTKAEGLAFAESLRLTRKVGVSVSFHDAIYAERYSRLLPTWSVTENLTDHEIMGKWLSGGVSVSTTSVRRLSSLVSCLDERGIIELITAAGLASDNAPRLTTDRPLNLGGETLFPDDESTFKLSGRPELRRFFTEHIIDIVQNPDHYETLGISFPSPIVLHGPPGCGKTFAVERLSEYLDWPTFYVDSDSVGSPYIHETSKKVGEVFGKAMEMAPSMLIIDEMEAYLSDRQIHQSAGIHHVEEVGEFLRRIPEAREQKVLVVGMTNRIEMIDSAILRRGRFDHVVRVPMPSNEEISELLHSLFAKLPVDGKIAIDSIVERLEGRALSDVTFVVREAARLAAWARKDRLDSRMVDGALTSLPALSQESSHIGFIARE